MPYKSCLKIFGISELNVRSLFVLSVCITMCSCTLESMSNIDFTTRLKTKGMTVTDLDQDGRYEVIIAVSNGPNIILQYSLTKDAYVDIGKERPEYLPIRDPDGRTMSVCACDMDGDGREEVFLLNEQPASLSSPNNQSNRLITHRNGSLVDLLSLAENSDLANLYSGNFVTCIDHDGDGAYALLLGSYRQDGSGVYKLFTAVSSDGASSPVLRDISQDVGLDVIRDGTSVVIGPIVNDAGYSDIFGTNSNEYFVSSNTYRHNKTSVLYRNQGKGRFEDVTTNYIQETDPQVLYGASIADINGDGTIDIVTCSMYGPARIYLRSPNRQQFQSENVEDNGIFIRPSGCMSMIVADFNNNGKLDVFKDNLQNDGSNNNRVFEVMSTPNELHVNMTLMDISERLQKLNVQGLTMADLNGDGLLELFVSHKEYGGTTLSIFQEGNRPINKWLRIIPLTIEGAPARGSKVTLTLSNYGTMTKVIGGACSRACQTEPFVHFGLGNMTSRVVEVTWPDGHVIRTFLNDEDNRKTLQISYTGQVVELVNNISENEDISAASFTKHNMRSIFLFLISLNIHKTLTYLT